VRKTFYGKTQADVLAHLTKARREQQLGLPVAPDRQTTGDFLTEWLEGTAKPRLRRRTFDDYKKVVNKHLIPSFGNVQLTKLGPEQVRHLFRTKAEEGLSARRSSHSRRSPHRD
jgi:integrase